MNGKRILVILMGLLIIVGGVICLFRPVSTFLTTGYMIGVIMFCDAIGNIAAYHNAKKYVDVSGWYLANAIISLIFSIVLIVSLKMQFAMDMVIIYIIAAWVIVLGISRISLAVRIKKLQSKLPNIFNNKKWVGILIIGILMIVFGAFCMYKPIVLSGILGVLMALFIIFTGVSLVTIGTYAYELS